jgi:hypothetical protein
VSALNTTATTLPRRKPEHTTGLWLANLSNFILCFTYFKAIFNTLLVRIGVKAESGFKVRGGQALTPFCHAARCCRWGLCCS